MHTDSCCRGCAPGRPTLCPECDSPWEQFVRTHVDDVFRLAYRLTGDLRGAEDIMQEVFSRVLRGGDLDDDGKPDRWIFRIATSVFLTGAGARCLRPTGGDVGALSSCGDIQQALNALDPGTRAAVVLRDVTRLTYAEIADTVGTDRAAVAQRVHHGRSHLRRVLETRAVPSAVGVDSTDGPR